ncbi:MAG: tRNA (guanosine(37)-N1)-methyltransferase TrmD [Candidatus Paceibacterota bacterium]|jgi:tRNA (guanine37-N1)-methyltransferase
MRFHIITIFPEIFDSYLTESIIGRAIKNKHISVKFYNPRDYVKSQNKANYKPVDDRPYGGGPGMIMRAEPILKAVEKAILVASKVSSGPQFGARPARKLSSHQNKILIINFVPSAEKFTTTFAKKVSKKYTDIILICGRYEGIDARVDKILRQAQDKFLKFKKISIGDYVLTGGELPTMILVDCISRQIPGVLGKYESLEEERVSSSEFYTRPEKLVYKGKKYNVPKVLLSGNHQLIEQWKKSSKK